MNLEEKENTAEVAPEAAAQATIQAGTGKQCPGCRYPGDSRSCGPTGRSL
ncbi:MAG: hypothetical protein ACLTBV_21345 [Enterocloster bolteae]